MYFLTILNIIFFILTTSTLAAYDFYPRRQPPQAHQLIKAQQQQPIQAVARPVQSSTLSNKPSNTALATGNVDTSFKMKASGAGAADRPVLAIGIVVGLGALGFGLGMGL